uniref:Uncharacterized protein n=1 Tax=Arundo donax TaxID=35708 RepID=A0A0A8Y990_ARUDO
MDMIWWCMMIRSYCLNVYRTRIADSTQMQLMPS